MLHSVRVFFVESGPISYEMLILLYKEGRSSCIGMSPSSSTDFFEELRFNIVERLVFVCVFFSSLTDLPDMGIDLEPELLTTC